MENKNLPAYPVLEEVPDASFFIQRIGLTKRELIAAMALQGLLADPGLSRIDTAAETAVKAADLLLSELEKQP